MVFEKSDLSIVVYGSFPTCVTSVAFSIHARHAHGLFAMECITMCSDMIFLHFKHIFINTNNISLIQILFKVSMRFFFLSVYNPPQLFVDLLYLGTWATGTVRLYRKGIPYLIKNTSLSNRGGHVHCALLAQKNSLFLDH